MQYDDYKWIWQYPNWTAFSWDKAKLEPELRRCWLLLGKLIGYSVQIEEQDSELSLNTLLSNILSSSQIEGENLNAYSVRSSLARKLNLSIETPYPTSDRSEGVSSIMLDALENWQESLSLSRLSQWHSWLFPYHTPHVNVGGLRGGRADAGCLRQVRPPDNPF